MQDNYEDDPAYVAARKATDDAGIIRKLDLRFVADAQEGARR